MVETAQVTLSKKDFKALQGCGCWQTLQFAGFEAFKVPAIFKTTLYGRGDSFQFDGIPIKGKKDLHIRNGGLQNSEISKRAKRLFKKKVKPVLMDIVPGYSQSFNGKLRLEFGNGVLQKMEVLTTH